MIDALLTMLTLANDTRYLARDQARGEDPRTQLKAQSDIGMVHSISPLCMPDLTRLEAPTVPFGRGLTKIT